MSKIGILIDPHITDRHRCRCDNFLETALNKSVDIVFDTSNMDEYFKNNIMEDIIKLC